MDSFRTVKLFSFAHFCFVIFAITKTSPLRSFPPKTERHEFVILIANILDFDSYSGVPNGDSNHENAGDGAPRGDRGGRPRRYNNRAPRRSNNSESGGKPAQGEKVNNFDN
jgi:hypothetical protein